MFRFSHKESYEYELPGTWLFRMIDLYITNLKMCSGRWTSILTSLRTYTIEAACHAVSVDLLYLQVLHSREYEWSCKSTVVEADQRESWSQTLPDARQTLPALKVIYDYCSLVNEHDFAVGLYFMFVQMFLSWVSDGLCWNIHFLEVQENDWYHVEIGGFSLCKVTCLPNCFMSSVCVLPVHPT
jgi:hypothetical protein